MNTFRTSDGLTLAWYKWGDATRALPVVLHHGFAANAILNWQSPGVVDALVAAGRRVVAIDARGHGQSEKPHDSAFYGEERMARDVAELADHIGAERFDLAGYSMGAIVSLICASSEPRIQKLAIGGIGDGVLARGGVDTRVVNNRVLVAALLAEDLSAVPPAALAFRRFTESTGADRKALAAQAAVVHAKPIPLDRITAPTLVLAGADDPFAAHPERLAAAIPNARVQVVPGDHLGAVRTPEFIRALADYFR